METSQNGRGNELARGIARGDSDAINEAYNMYFDGVYKWVFNQLQRDQCATEEVVQDTFMGAMKSASNFDGRCSFRTWLLSIASKKVVDFLRKNGNRKKNEIVMNQDDMISKVDAASSSMPSVNENEVALDIRSVMDSLPTHYRQVLTLKYIEGLSTIEIGEVLARTPRSVEGLLRRAREDFKTALQKIN